METNMTKKQEQESRAAFEAWAKPLNYPVDRMDDQPEAYEEDSTNDAWGVWQASRAAIGGVSNMRAEFEAWWELEARFIKLKPTDADKAFAYACWRARGGAIASKETQAAPVELPEPAATVHKFNSEINGVNGSYNIRAINSVCKKLPEGLHSLYTESQMRALQKKGG